MSLTRWLLKEPTSAVNRCPVRRKDFHSLRGTHRLPSTEVQIQLKLLGRISLIMSTSVLVKKKRHRVWVKLSKWKFWKIVLAMRTPVKHSSSWALRVQAKQVWWTRSATALKQTRKIFWRERYSSMTRLKWLEKCLACMVSMWCRMTSCLTTFLLKRHSPSLQDSG